MMKSKTNQEQTSTQPLVPGVPPPSSTRIETESLQKDMGLSAILLLDCLISETMSPDVLTLAVIQAKSRCKEMGMEPEVLEHCMTKLFNYAEKKRKQHPLSGMF